MPCLNRCLALFLLLGPTAAAAGAPPAPTKVEFVRGQEVSRPLWLEVADTPAAQALGLMYRPHLPDDRGMLFVFADAAPRAFWMKDTLVALDLIFVGANGRIVHLIADAPPKSEGSLICPAKCQYVVEVPAGTAKRLRLALGHQVLFSPPPALPAAAGPTRPAPATAAPTNPPSSSLAPR